MDSAKSIMDNKEEIPDHLMAQLIKAKLLHIKACEKEKEIQRAVSLINIHFTVNFSSLVSFGSISFRIV